MAMGPESRERESASAGFREIKSRRRSRRAERRRVQSTFRAGRLGWVDIRSRRNSSVQVGSRPAAAEARFSVLSWYRHDWKSCPSRFLSTRNSGDAHPPCIITTEAKRYTGPKGLVISGSRNAALEGPLFHGTIGVFLGTRSRGSAVCNSVPAAAPTTND
jgi:hypothetical protein